jgi:acyl carrier protein
LKQDLDLDSLDLAVLTVKIEAETGIDVFAEGIVETVGQLLAKLER